MRKFAIISFVAVALAVSANAAPVEGNGGFEVAGTSATDSAMWTEWASGGPTSVSERSTALVEFGSWSHHILAAGGTGIGGTAGINQNSRNDVNPASLQPGTTLSMTLDAAVNYGDGGNGIYTLRILNSAGGIVANTGWRNFTDTNLAWRSYSTATLTVPAFGAAPNDAYSAYVEIVMQAGAFPASNGEMYIDNLQIDGTLVPEPAALALVGLSLLFARRR